MSNDTLMTVTTTSDVKKFIFELKNIIGEFSKDIPDYPQMVEFYRDKISYRPDLCWIMTNVLRYRIGYMVSDISEECKDVFHEMFYVELMVIANYLLIKMRYSTLADLVLSMPTNEADCINEELINELMSKYLDKGELLHSALALIICGEYKYTNMVVNKELTIDCKNSYSFKQFARFSIDGAYHFAGIWDNNITLRAGMPHHIDPKKFFEIVLESCSECDIDSYGKSARFVIAKPIDETDIVFTINLIEKVGMYYIQIMTNTSIENLLDISKFVNAAKWKVMSGGEENGK